MRVVEVIDVKVSYNMRQSSMGILAIVEADDGATHEVHLTEASYSGSFYEPPDGEVVLTWDPKDSQGEPLAEADIDLL